MLKITKFNVEEVQAGIKSLLNNKDLLVKESKDYPLQIDLAGHRFTVNNKIDIENLTNLLQQEVNYFLFPREQTVVIKMLLEVEYKVEPGVSIYNLGTLLQDRVARVIEPVIPCPPELGTTQVVNWHLSSVTEEL